MGYTSKEIWEALDVSINLGFNIMFTMPKKASCIFSKRKQIFLFFFWCGCFQSIRAQTRTCDSASKPLAKLPQLGVIYSSKFAVDFHLAPTIDSSTGAQEAQEQSCPRCDLNLGEGFKNAPLSLTR